MEKADPENLVKFASHVKEEDDGWHEKNGVDLLSVDGNPSTQVFELVEYVLRETAKGKSR